MESTMYVGLDAHKSSIVATVVDRVRHAQRGATTHRIAEQANIIASGSA